MRNSSGESLYVLDVNLHTRSNTNMDAWQRGLFKAVSSHLFVTLFDSSDTISYSGGVHCTLRNQGCGPVQFDDKLLCTPDDARSLDIQRTMTW